MYWNCQGVKNKRLELIHLIQEKQIDIILLNETHLTNKEKLSIPNYFSYNTNRAQINNRLPGGGTAIIINRKIIHHQVQINTSSIENTYIRIQIGNTTTRLSSVYKKPTELLQINDIRLLLDTPGNTIIAGDLNAKHNSWNSLTSNVAGNILDQYIQSRNDISIAAPTSPTHYPQNHLHRPDILDIAILKIGNFQSHLENLTSALSSDHTPIILDIEEGSAQAPPPKPSHFTNWSIFETEMENFSVITPSSSKAHIDSAIQLLTSKLATSLEKSSQKSSLPDRKTNLPPSILAEIRNKRRLRSQWQRTRNPETKTLFNRQSTKVK